MSIKKELFRRKWAIWESREYVYFFPGWENIHLPSSSIPPVYMGFPGHLSKFIAVASIDDYVSIFNLPRYLFSFLTMINSHGGIGFIATSPKDIDWHINLERWKLLLDSEEKKELITKRFLKRLLKAINIRILPLYEEEVWRELFEWVFDHRDYDIWYSYIELKNNGADLAQWYGIFLQFYRSILTELFSIGFRGRPISLKIR